jgi:endonuclease/exonuclease/phosphatase family metal-dependent hydrolase
MEGNKQGDGEGEWTYINRRGETMIDYETVNEEAWERVEEFRIGKRVESDHLPLEISIEETNHKERGKGEQRRIRRRYQ